MQPVVRALCLSLVIALRKRISLGHNAPLPKFRPPSLVRGFVELTPTQPRFVGVDKKSHQPQVDSLVSHLFFCCAVLTKTPLFYFRSLYFLLYSMVFCSCYCISLIKPYVTSLLRSLSASGQVNKSCAGPGGVEHWAGCAFTFTHDSVNATAKVTDAETRVSMRAGERNLREALKSFYCNVHAPFCAKKSTFLSPSIT